MKKFTCIAALFLSCHIYAQNFATIKNGRLKTEVWISKTSCHGMAKNPDILKNQVHLSFCKNFNDTVVVVLNDKQICKRYLNTDDHSNKLFTNMILDINPDSKNNILTISLLNSNECMLVDIETQYKNIQVYKYKKWELHYTNYVLQAD